MKRTMILVGIGLVAIGCSQKEKAKDESKVQSTVDATINVSTNLSIEGPNSSQPIANYTIVNHDTIYFKVDLMPTFPGGELELLDFISKHLKYPITAQDGSIQGKVICRIIVTKTGKTKNPEVLRSVDPACDNEALIVLKTLPRFIPGKLRGRNVNVWYTIPVTFKLD